MSTGAAQSFELKSQPLRDVIPGRRPGIQEAIAWRHTHLVIQTNDPLVLSDSPQRIVSKDEILENMLRYNSANAETLSIGWVASIQTGWQLRLFTLILGPSP